MTAAALPPEGVATAAAASVATALAGGGLQRAPAAAVAIAVAVAGQLVDALAAGTLCGSGGHPRQGRPAVAAARSSR